MDTSYEILDFIEEKPEAFDRIESLSIEYQSRFHSSISKVKALKNIKELELI